MLQGNTTGIDPFVPWSTFKGPTIEIPKGLFLGGIFYTSEEYVPPCHISFIYGEDQDCLGTWGIADSTGKELGQIIFTEANPNLGNILTTNVEYGGCLKGRIYNYNDRTTYDNQSNIDELPKSDLEVFLKSVSGEHILNDDTLIFDVCACCSVPKKSVDQYKLTSVELAADTELKIDDNGMYYIAEKNSTPIQDDYIHSLICTAGSTTVELSGPVINIIPWTMADTTTTWTDGEPPISGSTIHNESIGVEDISIVAANGGLVIGTKNQVSRQTS